MMTGNVLLQERIIEDNFNNTRRLAIVMLTSSVCKVSVVPTACWAVHLSTETSFFYRPVMKRCAL